MGFKEMVEADNAAVFMNINEFAEFHTVKYDGREFRHIPLVLEKIRQSELSLPVTNHTDGLYTVSAKAYFRAADADGHIPEQGKSFEIDDGEALGRTFFNKYRVATVDDAMGMICLELEGIDE
ncbi:MAG: hypothetical protein NC299_08865 [Lachnospiraceae bacterium]|nr:hypothetical protein [Lachnospiraceae bacterium]